MLPSPQRDSRLQHTTAVKGITFKNVNLSANVEKEEKEKEEAYVDYKILLGRGPLYLHRSIVLFQRPQVYWYRKVYFGLHLSTICHLSEDKEQIPEHNLIFHPHE